MTIKEFISKNNIIVREDYSLPGSVKACCYHDTESNEFILVNGYLSPSAKKEALNHEINHLLNGECYDKDYIEY